MTGPALAGCGRAIWEGNVRGAGFAGQAAGGGGGPDSFGPPAGERRPVASGWAQFGLTCSTSVCHSV